MWSSLFHSRHGRLEEAGNLFTPLRMLIAGLVLYSHALVIILGKPFEGAWAQLADFTAHRGLDGFFILSGYMLTASVLRSNDMRAYTIARILRIFPGLIVTVLLIWLVVGPLFTQLPAGEYWSHTQTWMFPVQLLSQADPLAGLPGLFAMSPVGHAANGPLWTIRYELICYVALGLLAGLGLFRSRALILVWAALAVLGATVFPLLAYSGPGEATLAAMVRFAPAFMIGAAFYAAREQVPLAPGYVILAIIGTLANYDTILFPVLLQIATAWAVLALGYAKLPRRLHDGLTALPDLSYGIYILHWPIGMMALSLWPGLTTSQLFAIMLPAAVMAGWVLHMAVEKPAMVLKSKLQARMRQPDPSPAPQAS